MTSASFPSHVTIVGMGYVGLPLAVAFSHHLPVTGYDRSDQRVEELRNGIDHNGEVSVADLNDSGIEFTCEASCLSDATFIVVTVPTPVDENHEPDLTPLISASEAIGDALRNRTPGLAPPVIVFESTTFPGCTEQVCAPAIAARSGLEAGKGFLLGYSPERTNFGDPEHGLESIVKVVSGQDKETGDLVQSVYDLICPAGTYRAPDIRTAEAAKVIENIQRDLNIALVNELAMVFDRLGISTSEVIAAAATKWNFVPYRPGLVGGHCIPVDPYYLTYRARQAGYHPEVILAGRRVNESMAGFVADKLIQMLRAPMEAGTPREVLVLGATFKANISDTRNSKVLDLIRKLVSLEPTVFRVKVSVHDPRVPDEIFSELGVTPVQTPFDRPDRYDAVVLATPHAEFVNVPLEKLVALVARGGVLMDLAGAIDRTTAMSLGVRYWRP